MNIPTQYTYPLEAALEQWTDNREIHADDVESLLLFTLYVPKALSQIGVKVMGYTSRHKAGQRLLTVKAKENGTPLIVFITSDTTIGCMSRFLTLMEDDRLTWVKDRYPWN